MDAMKDYSGMMGGCPGMDMNMMPNMGIPYMENMAMQNPMIHMEYMYMYYKYMCKYMEYMEKCKEHEKKGD